MKIKQTKYNLEIIQTLTISIPACMQFHQFSLLQGSASMNYIGESPRLDLKLNLSPPRDDRQVVSPKGPISSTEISPRSSCVSRETSPDGTLPEGISMMLVGCPRCLMYVMLFDQDPKCPKCKSTVLLDFLHDKTPRFNN